jgi:PAS domain S-box-containing protein
LKINSTENLIGSGATMIGNGILPSKISEIHKLVEGLQGCLNNASEESDFLSKTFEELRACLKELSAASKENERRLMEAEKKASELNATISSMAGGVISYSPKGETVRNEVGVIENQRDGRVIWTDNGAAPVYSADGRLQGVAATFTDITERKRIEEALREREAELRLVADGVPLLLAHVSFDLRYLFVNQSYADWFILPKEEIIGRHISEILSPEDYKGSQPAIKKVLAGEKTNFSLVVQRDGQPRALDVAFIPQLDEHRKVRSYYTITQDITERMRADQALRESKQRFRDAIDNFPNVFVIYDSDRRIKYINSKGLQIIGCSEQEVIGRKDEEIFPPEMINSYLPALKRAIETKTSQMLERKRHARMGGQTVIVDIIPLLNEYGEVRQILGISYDITERKQMEEELRRSRNELELRVQERTAELSRSREELEVTNEELQVELTQHERLEKDLITAKEAAEEAARVKAAFMANMSHELRTPMNAVIGMTSLLLDEKLAPEQKDYVETIRSGGEALMALINDILDFSKMEREETEIDLRDIDLRRHVEEALDLLAKNASEKNLDLAYTFEDGMPDVIIGDPARLRQVLVNLLSNAIKFTDHGEVVLTVTPEQNGKIRFSIRDTGIGIPSDKMNLLFLPFSQVDMSITRGYDGAGLGLAISKKLVELMGGEIWAESENGKGSTFHFTIKGEAVSAKPKPFPGVLPQLEGQSVLIIEDKRATRRILGQQILSWDMIPTIASSIQEVQKWVKGENAYDAVILDTNIPGADEMAETIHKRGLPMVAIVSIGQHADNKFAASISKPVKPAQICGALLKILTQKNQELQAVAAKEKTDYGPLRILLAEDNKSNRKVTLQMLMKLGYRADAVANGAEAVEALKRQQYDLILMDVKMPVMNGIEAAREIRRHWPDNGPKIIALTAYALAGDRERCLEAGMDGYLSKPVQLNDMADVLARQRCPEK